MELAALATRAVPGLSPTGVADAPDDARDFMAAIVIDSSGNRWRVRGPQHTKDAMRLETEVQKATDATIADIDAALASKEKEILGK